MRLAATRPAPPTATPWAPISVHALNARLLAAHSATAVLEALCGGPIRIRRLPPAPSPRASLASPTLHRHVELHHEGIPLSTAHLWYRPACLPEPMQAALAQTDAPFGRVVAPMGLRRHTRLARLAAPGEPFALEHHAILALPGGEPVAEVREYYTWALVSAAG